MCYFYLEVSATSASDFQNLHLSVGKFVHVLEKLPFQRFCGLVIAENDEKLKVQIKFYKIEI